MFGNWNYGNLWHYHVEWLTHFLIIKAVTVVHWRNQLEIDRNHIYQTYWYRDVRAFDREMATQARCTILKANDHATATARKIVISIRLYCYSTNFAAVGFLRVSIAYWFKFFYNLLKGENILNFEYPKKREKKNEKLETKKNVENLLSEWSIARNFAHSDSKVEINFDFS